MLYGFYVTGAKARTFAAAMLCGSAALSLGAAPALAQTAPDSATTLANLLVKRGVISRKDAEAFIRQAHDEAASSRSPASPKAAAGVPQAAAAATATTTPPDDGAMHVTYVPETVRQQMKKEIRQEVMQEARDDRWAAPDTMPAWTQHIRLFGDIRTRYEGDFFPSGNDNTGAFPNFNAINTGSPFDVSRISNPNFPPEYNVDKDRNRFRLQLRFGLDADLGEDFKAGFRIGTGSDNQPVSLNQSLGGNG
ncbi:MAG TPA: putative porin, partial [Rhizomicrobium sp.]|nr:putative porin [Rhizomicrobium sp.]